MPEFQSEQSKITTVEKQAAAIDKDTGKKTNEQLDAELQSKHNIFFKQVSDTVKVFTEADKLKDPIALAEMKKDKQEIKDLLIKAADRGSEILKAKTADPNFQTIDRSAARINTLSSTVEGNLKFFQDMDQASAFVKLAEDCLTEAQTYEGNGEKPKNWQKSYKYAVETGLGNLGISGSGEYLSKYPSIASPELKAVFDKIKKRSDDAFSQLSEKRLTIIDQGNNKYTGDDGEEHEFTTDQISTINKIKTIRSGGKGGPTGDTYEGYIALAPLMTSSKGMLEKAAKEKKPEDKKSAIDTAKEQLGRAKGSSFIVAFELEMIEDSVKTLPFELQALHSGMLQNANAILSEANNLLENIEKEKTDVDGTAVVEAADKDYNEGDKSGKASFQKAISARDKIMAAKDLNLDSKEVTDNVEDALNKICPIKGKLTAVDRASLPRESQAKFDQLSPTIDANVQEIAQIKVLLKSSELISKDIDMQKYFRVVKKEINGQNVVIVEQTAEFKALPEPKQKALLSQFQAVNSEVLVDITQKMDMKEDKDWNEAIKVFQTGDWQTAKKLMLAYVRKFDGDQSKAIQVASGRGLLSGILLKEFNEAKASLETLDAIQKDRGDIADINHQDLGVSVLMAWKKMDNAEKEVSTGKYLCIEDVWKSVGRPECKDFVVDGISFLNPKKIQTMLAEPDPEKRRANILKIARAAQDAGMTPFAKKYFDMYFSDRIEAKKKTVTREDAQNAFNNNPEHDKQVNDGIKSAHDSARVRFITERNRRLHISGMATQDQIDRENKILDKWEEDYSANSENIKSQVISGIIDDLWNREAKKSINNDLKNAKTIDMNGDKVKDDPVNVWNEAYSGHFGVVENLTGSSLVFTSDDIRNTAAQVAVGIFYLEIAAAAGALTGGMASAAILGGAVEVGTGTVIASQVGGFIVEGGVMHATSVMLNEGTEGFKDPTKFMKGLATSYLTLGLMKGVGAGLSKIGGRAATGIAEGSGEFITPFGKQVFEGSVKVVKGVSTLTGKSVLDSALMTGLTYGTERLFNGRKMTKDDLIRSFGDNMITFMVMGAKQHIVEVGESGGEKPENKTKEQGAANKTFSLNEIDFYKKSTEADTAQQKADTAKANNSPDAKALQTKADKLKAEADTLNKKAQASAVLVDFANFNALDTEGKTQKINESLKGNGVSKPEDINAVKDGNIITKEGKTIPVFDSSLLPEDIRPRYEEMRKAEVADKSEKLSDLQDLFKEQADLARDPVANADAIATLKTEIEAKCKDLDSTPEQMAKTIDQQADLYRKLDSAYRSKEKLFAESKIIKKPVLNPDGSPKLENGQPVFEEVNLFANYESKTYAYSQELFSDLTYEKLVAEGGCKIIKLGGDELLVYHAGPDGTIQKLFIDISNMGPTNDTATNISGTKANLVDIFLSKISTNIKAESLAHNGEMLDPAAFNKQVSDVSRELFSIDRDANGKPLPPEIAEANFNKLKQEWSLDGDYAKYKTDVDSMRMLAEYRADTRGLDSSYRDAEGLTFGEHIASQIEKISGMPVADLKKLIAENPEKFKALIEERIPKSDKLKAMSADDIMAEISKLDGASSKPEDLMMLYSLMSRVDISKMSEDPALKPLADKLTATRVELVGNPPHARVEAPRLMDAKVVSIPLPKDVMAALTKLSETDPTAAQAILTAARTLAEKPLDNLKYSSDKSKFADFNILDHISLVDGKIVIKSEAKEFKEAYDTNINDSKTKSIIDTEKAITDLKRNLEILRFQFENGQISKPNFDTKMRAISQKISSIEKNLSTDPDSGMYSQGYMDVKPTKMYSFDGQNIDSQYRTWNSVTTELSHAGVVNSKYGYLGMDKIMSAYAKVLSAGIAAELPTDLQHFKIVRAGGGKFEIAFLDTRSVEALAQKGLTPESLVRRIAEGPGQAEVDKILGTDPEAIEHAKSDAAVRNSQFKYNKGTEELQVGKLTVKGEPAISPEQIKTVLKASPEASQREIIGKARSLNTSKEAPATDSPAILSAPPAIDVEPNNIATHYTSTFVETIPADVIGEGKISKDVPGFIDKDGRISYNSEYFLAKYDVKLTRTADKNTFQYEGKTYSAKEFFKLDIGKKVLEEMKTVKQHESTHRYLETLDNQSSGAVTKDLQSIIAADPDLQSALTASGKSNSPRDIQEFLAEVSDGSVKLSDTARTKLETAIAKHADGFTFDKVRQLDTSLVANGKADFSREFIDTKYPSPPLVFNIIRSNGTLETGWRIASVDSTNGSVVAVSPHLLNGQSQYRTYDSMAALHSEIEHAAAVYPDLAVPERFNLNYGPQAQYYNCRIASLEANGALVVEAYSRADNSTQYLRYNDVDHLLQGIDFKQVGQLEGIKINTVLYLPGSKYNGAIVQSIKENGQILLTPVDKDASMKKNVSLKPVEVSIYDMRSEQAKSKTFSDQVDALRLDSGVTFEPNSYKLIDGPYKGYEITEVTNGKVVLKYGPNQTKIIESANFPAEVGNVVKPPRNDIVRPISEVPRSNEVVAVGDLHGNGKIFVENLRSIGVIDANADFANPDSIKWVGGNRRVVFHGDILADRGTDSFGIMAGIRKLQAEAKASGGEVSLIAGNHEDFAISFLTGSKTADGQDWMNYAMSGGQADGIAEFISKFGDMPGAKSFFEVIQSKYMKDPAALLKVMRANPEGRALLEQMSKMKLAEYIDDTMFTHTDPSPEMIQLIASSGKTVGEAVDLLNAQYQQGLRYLLLGEGSLPPNFDVLRKAFTDTNNRSSGTEYAQVDLAPLKSKGVNRLIHGHSKDSSNKIIVKDGVEVTSVDFDAGKKGKKMDERSIGKIDTNGKLSVGNDVNSDLRATEQLKKTGTLDSLPDQYYVPTYEGGKENIYIDRKNDANLIPIINELLPLQSMAPLDKISSLNQIMVKYTNRPDALAKAAQLTGNQYLGQIIDSGSAGPRHRAILYQLLGEKLGLKVTTRQGYFRNQEHTWNELKLDNGSVLVVDASKVNATNNQPTYFYSGSLPSAYYYDKQGQPLYLQPGVVAPAIAK